MYDINDIAKQLAADFALRQGRVEEAERQLGKVLAEIDAAYEHKRQVQEECKAACEAAIQMREKHEAETRQAHGELGQVLAQIEAQRATLAKEKDAHKDAISQLKGSYKVAVAELEGQVNSLKARKDAMQRDINALIAKWSA